MNLLYNTYMLKEFFKGYTVAVTGICKNAGKTTLLNEIIKEARGRVAFTSVGLDGERTDAVTSTPKPSVFLKKGMVVATAESALLSSDISKRILDVTDINTPLGRVVIAEALSDGFILLAGASSYAETVSVREKLKKVGVERFYVDGAVSRRAFATSELCDSMALCVGASYSYDLNRIAAAVRHLVWILTLPIAKEGLELSGAVNDSAIEKLARSTQNSVILCDDPGKLVFGEKARELLSLTRNTLAVKARAELCLVAVNPYSVYGASCDPDALINCVREIVPENIPVCDVCRGVYI